MRRSPLALRLGLALGGLLVGLGLAELAVRLWAPGGSLFGAPQDIPPEAWRGDPQLFQVPVPGWSGEVLGLEYRAHLRFDQDGLRGDGARDGAPRVLLLGDSFALGAQVDESETLAARLGAALDGRVFNAGVDGYSTWQAALRYTRLAPELKPDVVVLLYFLGNDLADNERFPSWSGRSYELRPRARTLGQHLARRSWLFAFFEARWQAARLTRGESDEASRYRRELAPFSTEGAAVLAEQLAPTREALERIGWMAKAYGDRLVVALAPPAFVVETARAGPTLALAGLAQPDLQAPARAVAAALDGLGIVACDLEPALKAAAQTQRTYFRFDGHWTPAGHAAAAEAMVGCLTDDTPEMLDVR